MTTNTDVVNQALQIIGTRTTVTTTELTNAANGNFSASSNEAINANLIMFRLRDNLNRMAPWGCTSKWANLTYITSLPGTPENTTQSPPLWQPGIPPPPWIYEYQYPVDCLRMRKILPPNTTPNTGIPIYPPGTVTGLNMLGWLGPPQKWDAATDQFFALTAAAPSTGGAGYIVGDIIVLSQPSFTFTQGGVQYTMPVGAPAQLLVTAIGGGGSVTTVSVVNQVQGEASSLGGSYYSPNGALGTQGSTTGIGAGAVFTLTFASAATPQRVIICNQEQALACYNQQITDPNIFDQMFVDAWAGIIGARLVPALQGDKSMIKVGVDIANSLIMEARKADGNEALTVNDVTPDYIRARGVITGPNWEYSPNIDWGPLFGY